MRRSVAARVSASVSPVQPGLVAHRRVVRKVVEHREARHDHGEPRAHGRRDRAAVGHRSEREHREVGCGEMDGELGVGDEGEAGADALPRPRRLAPRGRRAAPSSRHCPTTTTSISTVRWQGRHCVEEQVDALVREHLAEEQDDGPGRVQAERRGGHRRGPPGSWVRGDPRPGARPPPASGPHASSSRAVWGECAMTTSLRAMSTCRAATSSRNTGTWGSRLCAVQTMRYPSTCAKARKSSNPRCTTRRVRDRRAPRRRGTGAPSGRAGGGSRAP